ncbi:MAG TPA: asparaginase [Desulfovibrio sp.]|jgi:L-asparaginase|uniref:asparaginase n=1 Tax=Desulfovibrio TaxID=872 RepID=UPI002A4DCCD6|nr:asparaginase [Desulfovibrio sp.]MDY0306697.1 asparaginase [Desulfovibrionaceae bacterium]HMM38323.1 asparaginase [Desulfovibrio sp.]
MGKVIVLTTGGTIASVRNEATGLFTSGAMPGEKLVDRNRLDLDIEVEAESVFQVPSNAMDFGKLMILRAKILERLTDEDVLGIVVTHGTDTLEESSYFMDLVLDCRRPVVFTGAQRAPSDEGTDCYANIRDAVVAAACPDCAGLGVLVVFNEGVYCAKYVRKMHAFNMHAFTAFTYGQLGYVDKGLCFLYQKPLRREHHVPTKAFPLVEIVKASLGSDGDVINYLTDSGAAGIVLEGLGRGHVTPRFMTAVQRAVDKGVHVVITTTCEQGRVHPVYDFPGGVRDLQARGVIAGHDYSSHKARIKLSVLLASGVDSSQDLREAFAV